MLRRKRLVLVPVVLISGLAAAIALASQPGERAVAAAASVGRVQGTEAFIALTYDGKRLRAYACDGSARRPATMSAWFEAPWDGREPIAIGSASTTAPAGSCSPTAVSAAHSSGRGRPSAGSSW